MSEDDVKPEIISYPGFEIISLIAGKSSQVASIQNEIAAKNMTTNVRVVRDSFETQSLVLVRFFTRITPSDRGYYVGNEQGDLDKQHGFFMQNLNDELIKFYS